MRPKLTNSAHRQSGSPRTPARRVVARSRPMAVLALLFGLLAVAAGPAAAAGLTDAAAAHPAAVAAVAHPQAASGARTATADAAERVEAAPAAAMKWRHSTHSSYHHVTNQASFTSHSKPKKKMGFFKKLGIFLIVIIVVVIVIVILLIWMIVHFIRKAFRRRD
ncbi:hypothetical protein ACFVT2_01105 [Streptomyces sp. NPDC058000]|uniref:hypothetical protein n=1 Tax=Streptomyces sp. NPDC058000 TaxID=3346299 RepID=UPI0036E23662